MTATEELRRMLDERGVEYTTSDGEHVKETCWPYMGELMAAFVEFDNGTTRFACDTWCFTPEQAIAATLGRAYEPPVAAHWDGDVLTLTIPRDPSCIRVQRSAEQPCKVYADESKVIAATLGAGTCHNASIRLDESRFHCSECGFGCWVKDVADGRDKLPRYCPNCGRKVVTDG